MGAVQDCRSVVAGLPSQQVYVIQIGAKNGDLIRREASHDGAGIIGGVEALDSRRRDRTHPAGVLVWTPLTTGTFYDDPVPDLYTQRDSQRAKNHAIHELHALGYDVTLEPRGAA